MSCLKARPTNRKTCNPKPKTKNLKSEIWNLKSEIPKLQPETCNLAPRTCTSGRGLPGLPQKLFDPLAVFLGMIEREMNFRCAAQLNAFRQLMANVSDGCRESSDRALLLGLGSD